MPFDGGSCIQLEKALNACIGVSSREVAERMAENAFELCSAPLEPIYELCLSIFALVPLASSNPT